MKMDLEKYKFVKISSRQRLSPFPNYLSMECICKEMQEAIGVSFKHILTMFKKNTAYIYWDEKDHARVSSFILKKVLENPKVFHELVERQEKFGPELIGKINEFRKKDLGSYSNEDLALFQGIFEKNYKKVYSNYFPILAVELPLAKYLKDYLMTKVSDSKLVEEYFNDLITEPRAQVNVMENYAALKLAKKIVENTVWDSYFFDDLEKTEGLVEGDSHLNKLFLEHTNNFYWITRDYEDPVLTYSDFVRRIGELLKKDPLTLLNELQDKLDSVDSRINEIETDLDIDKKHSDIFLAMREGLHLKELRKAYVSQSLYHYDPIMGEIADRSGISLNQARHLRTGEVGDVFTDENLKKELSERIELCVFFTEGGKTNLIIGKEAKKIFEKFRTIDPNIKELKGTGVSPGKASGKVIIIMNPDEIGKVEDGDIIVSTQIVPSFAKALKKSAGLICDGGTGITSHSATLSREAKVPCVTGTKIATKVLKDGEEVEIDGYKGIVKRN